MSAGGGRDPVSRNVVSVAPRSRRLSSWSLPRLRSHPIQRPCASFQTRRRCSRRKRSAPAAVAMAAVEPGDAGDGRRHEVGVSSVVSASASVQSDRSAKCTAPRGIGEIVDLQPLELLVDRRAGRQQRRDGDEGAQLRRHAVAQRRGRAASIAPKPPVIARLTSSNAASIAGRRPIRTITAPCQPVEADLLRARAAAGRERPRP